MGALTAKPYSFQYRNWNYLEKLLAIFITPFGIPCHNSKAWLMKYCVYYLLINYANNDELIT